MQIHLGGIDLNASGLRLPGCYKKGGNDVYMPLHQDMSIHPQANEKVTRYYGSRLLIENPAIISGMIKKINLSAVQDVIRRYNHNWSNVTITHGRTPMFLRASTKEKHFCFLKGSFHKSNKIYFTLEHDMLFQRCYKCKCRRHFVSAIISKQ